MAAWWLVLAAVAWGWDADGHAAIGMTCMSNLKMSALSQLKRLLGGKDVVDISPWSHQLTAKYPEMEAIYYQTQDRDVSEGFANCEHFRAADNCSDGNCIVGALSHYFAELMGDADNSDFQSPLKLKLTDTDLIKLIVSLVGELHSVSRFGYTYNRGGKDQPLSYLDSTTRVETDQFSYWDHDLVQKTIKDRPHYWFSGWTHVNNLARQIITHEEQTWKGAENKTALFELWAASTFRDACTRAFRERTKNHYYTKVSVAAKGASVDFLDTPVLTGSVSDPQAPKRESDLNYSPNALLPGNHGYIDFDLIKSKILIGGLRLSFVLNHILTHKDAKKLRVGSAVQLKNHPPVNSRSGIFGQASGGKEGSAMALNGAWRTNLVINLAIIAVVVGAFVAFLTLSGDAAAPAKAAGEPGVQLKHKD